MLRYKGDSWQENTISLPWDSSVLNTLVAFLSDDARRLVAFQADLGNYATYFATKSTEDISSTPEHFCQLGLWDQSPWKAASYDSTTNLLIVGNERGALVTLDLTSLLCPTLAQLPVIRTQAKILTIKKIKESLYIATTDDGTFHLFTETEKKLSVSKSFKNSCTYPIFPEGFRLDEVAYICLDGVHAKENELTYTGSRLEIYNYETGQYALQLPFYLAKYAGISFDISSQKLFLLEDTSLGLLRIWDGTTGQGSRKEGLFLKSLL